MPLTLSLARHADAKRIAEIHMAAFASNVMLHAQFPTPTIRDGLQRSVELKALADIDDAKTTVLVVRDSPQAQAHRSWQRADEDSQQQAHGQVVAFAKWAHPVVVGEEYTEPSWVWPDGTEWDILDKWTKRTEEAQQNVIGRMPCYRKFENRSGLLTCARKSFNPSMWWTYVFHTEEYNILTSYLKVFISSVRIRYTKDKVRDL